MIDQLFNLKNKVALITGSSRGIGYTLAKGLAQTGCKVIINGTKNERVNNVANEFKEKGLNAFAAPFDVTDENQITEKIKQVTGETGPIDILLNNAGIQIRSTLEDFEKVDWQKILDINLSGAFLTAKAVIKSMIARKEGKIINICSIQSELARPTIAPYAASKGGLKMLTQGMATDWGKYNIQVNAIAPGYFKTELTKKLYEDEKFDSWLCARVPANRWGDPQELLGAAIFLASKASDYVNGHTLYVDGGLKSCV